jgi:hypothetical protein
MKSIFDNIKLVQLSTLVDIINDSQIRHISYVERKYLENALFFDETLFLLKSLNIIKGNSERLSCSKVFSNKTSAEDFSKKILRSLFSCKGQIAEQLHGFLVNFQSQNDVISFNASQIEKIKFSSVRNLLLELQFIEASADRMSYNINPFYTNLFVDHFTRRKLSPELFKKKQADSDSVGLLAEKEIIDFEIDRLKSLSIVREEIEHTSQKNVLAGYDIKSFENFLDENSNRIYRYIEVKAVSSEDFKFYWSRNEIEISRLLRDRYFLYLLPVKSSSKFNLQGLKIIQNPYFNLFLSTEWNKKEEVFTFSMSN